MNQLPMLHQLHTMRLLLAMEKTDVSRAALAQAEERCCAPTTTAWGAGGDEDDQHADEHQDEECTRNSRVTSTNEASNLFRSSEHTSCTSSNHRISTTNTSCFLSRISPSPSYFSSHPSPGPSSSSSSKKRRRIVIKSPDNKMPRTIKTQRISEPRNVEAPKCRSLLPNVGINDSSSSIGDVSIESADDDFFGFEDLECVWWWTDHSSSKSS